MLFPRRRGLQGFSFLWLPGRLVEVRENSWAYLNSPAFTASPATVVFRTGEYVRRRLAGPEATRKFAFLEEIARDGFTDFLAAPLNFITGQTHAITFATRRREGFSDDDLQAIRTIMPPLSRITETFALLRIDPHIAGRQRALVLKRLSHACFSSVESSSEASHIMLSTANVY
jgi:adenylate cyclase